MLPVLVAETTMALQPKFQARLCLYTPTPSTTIQADRLAEESSTDGDNDGVDARWRHEVQHSVRSDHSKPRAGGQDLHKRKSITSLRFAWWVAAGTVLALVVALAAFGLVASSGGTKRDANNNCNTALATSQSCATRVSDLQDMVMKLEAELNETAAVLATAVDNDLETQARLANLFAAAKKALPPMVQKLVAECKSRTGDFVGYQTLHVSEEDSVICTTVPTPIKLMAEDGTTDDRFGYSVTSGGDGLVVIGARGDDDDVRGDDSGSAYLFRVRSAPKQPELIAKLVSEDGMAVDVFGNSVAAGDDGLVVIGAHGGNTLKGSNSGFVYLYRFSTTDTSPQLMAKLVADDGQAYDNFGYAIAVGEGGLVAIGAPRNDEKAENAGSAYLYHVNVTTGTSMLLTKLVPDDGEANDNFGFSVAIGGDGLVVVGGYHDTGKRNESGSAYLFRVKATTGTVESVAKLIPHDDGKGEGFGYSVAAGADGLVLIAAVFDRDNGLRAGAVYVYRVDQTDTPMLLTKLVAHDGAAGHHFGVSVAVGETGDDSLMVVGAYLDDDKGAGSASVYLYRVSTAVDSMPRLVTKLVADDGGEVDRFGWSVALGVDGVLVVGAQTGDTAMANDSGSAYVYLPVQLD